MVEGAAPFAAMAALNDNGGAINKAGSRHQRIIAGEKRPAGILARLNGDHAGLRENHHAVAKREQGVIFSAPDVDTRLKLGAALTDDD